MLHDRAAVEKCRHALARVRDRVLVVDPAAVEEPVDGTLDAVPQRNGGRERHEHERDRKNRAPRRHEAGGEPVRQQQRPGICERDERRDHGVDERLLHEPVGLEQVVAGDRVADREREEEARQRQQAERQPLAEEEDREDAQYRHQERDDGAREDDARAAACERRAAAESRDGDRRHAGQRCRRDRQEDDRVQHVEALVPAPEQPQLGHPDREADGVQPSEGAAASPDGRPRLGDRQRQVQDRGRCEPFQEQREPVEAVGGEQVEVEEQVETPDDAEREEGATLSRLRLQVEDGEPDREERNAVQRVHAERRDPVPQGEHHGAHAATLLAAGPFEDELVQRAGACGADPRLDVVPRRHHIAVDAHHPRAEGHAGHRAGPAGTAERDDEQVVPHDEAGEGVSDLGERAHQGDRGKRDARQ